MFYGGELNVPGAPGNNVRTMEYRYGRDDGGTAVPVGVGYTPQPSNFVGLPGAVGNLGAIAHGSHTPDFTHDGIPRYVTPGTHNPKQHNPPVDPAGNPIESLRPKDSDIPLPGYGGNQSSNLPTAIPQSSTAFPVGNVGYQIAQAQTGIGQPKQGEVKSNLLNPIDWFSGRNQETAGEVKEGTYKGGKGGSIDSMLRRTSDLNKLMNEM
jgi:hypothetical protein